MHAESAGLQLHTFAGHMHMVYYSQSSIKHEAQRWKCFFTLVELRTACLPRKIIRAASCEYGLLTAMDSLSEKAPRNIMLGRVQSCATKTPQQSLAMLQGYGRTSSQ